MKNAKKLKEVTEKFIADSGEKNWWVIISGKDHGIADKRQPKNAVTVNWKCFFDVILPSSLALCVVFTLIFVEYLIHVLI